MYFTTPWINVNATKTLTCNSSSKTWDYKINGASFDVSTDADLTCTATKTANATTQSFAQYIASLAGTTQGDGQLVNENGYRYEGKDPNNYIWFNNEMWRIIGAFGSNRHGVSNTNLVKIVRNETIGDYSWDKESTSTNNWSNSTLRYLLNGCYYNALGESGSTNISGSDTNCSTYCGSLRCDFTATGIHSTGKYFDYKEMIENVTWYLGGPGASGYTTYYPSNIFGYETNSSAIYSGNPTSETSKVGLIYLSDYGYGALASSCARTSHVLNTQAGYGTTACAGNNWLFSLGESWTITPSSSSSTLVWYIGYYGPAQTYDATSLYDVLPVVYLKSNTYKLSGTGSKTDPYYISLPS